MTGPALPASRAASAAHLFVDDVEAPVLAADDRHHVERVLRVRAGELVTVSDGRGRWRWLVAGPSFEPASDVRDEERSQPSLTVAFAVLKGDRNELVVQKLTELGIDRIVPLLAERCVARWEGERGERHRERLARVAREAAMQSRRVWLPEVAPPSAFGAFTGDHVAMCAGDGGPLTAGHTTLLVGPEGGWSDTEDASGLARVRLGPNVLRAETAAITAGAFVAAIRSSLVMPYAT